MRRLRGEGGVALVEAAFAIPVLFLFISGVIDVGMWAFNQNQAANAARDGARMAILDYRTVDVVGSPSWEAVVDRVEKRLPGKSIGASEIAIACVDAQGDALAGGCAGAAPGTHRVRVTVSWDWDLVTPVAGAIGVDKGAVAGSANMIILGLPIDEGSATSSTSTTTTAPTSTTTSSPTTTAPASTTSTTTSPPTTSPSVCNVSALSVAPTPAKAKNAGALQDDLTVSFQAYGAGCLAMSIQLVAPGGGSVTKVCGCGTGPALSWTYDKNADHFWSAGTATIRVLRGASVAATTTFSVT